MILEVNKKLCKTCGEPKTCILVGKFDDKNKKFTDETGSYWNGRLCPQCNLNRVKNYMSKKRETIKLTNAQVDDQKVSNG